MGGHWMLLTAVGFMAAGVVGLCLWWIYGRILLLSAHKYQSSTKRFSLPPWRRASPKAKVSYELVEHEDGV